MALPKRDASKIPVQPGGEPWEDLEFAQDYPSLHAFLYDATYESGEVRKTGSIVIYTRLNGLWAAVNDNDRGLSAHVTARTWAELLTKVDLGICSDNIGWKRRPPMSLGGTPPF